MTTLLVFVCFELLFEIKEMNKHKSQKMVLLRYSEFFVSKNEQSKNVNIQIMKIYEARVCVPNPSVREWALQLN